VIDIRHAASVAEAVVKRFMRSGNDFPERMKSIGTAQSAFASAAIARSSRASVYGDEATKLMLSGNGFPKDVKRSCHDRIDRCDDMMEFMRSGNDFPARMNCFSRAPILFCRGRREFCPVATSIVRSGNDFPERRKRFARVVLRAARGEVEACRVLLTLGREPTSFADAVLRV